MLFRRRARSLATTGTFAGNGRGRLATSTVVAGDGGSRCEGRKGWLLATGGVLANDDTARCSRRRGSWRGRARTVARHCPRGRGHGFSRCGQRRSPLRATVAVVGRNGPGRQGQRRGPLRTTTGVVDDEDPGRCGNDAGRRRKSGVLSSKGPLLRRQRGRSLAGEAARFSGKRPGGLRTYRRSLREGRCPCGARFIRRRRGLRETRRRLPGGPGGAARRGRKRRGRGRGPRFQEAPPFLHALGRGASPPGAGVGSAQGGGEVRGPGGHARAPEDDRPLPRIDHVVAHHLPVLGDPGRLARPASPAGEGERTGCCRACRASSCRCTPATRRSPRARRGRCVGSRPLASRRRGGGCVAVRRGPARPPGRRRRCGTSPRSMRASGVPGCPRRGRDRRGMEAGSIRKSRPRRRLLRAASASGGRRAVLHHRVEGRPGRRPRSSRRMVSENA